MSNLGLESALDGIIERLNATLNTTIDAVNTDYTDGLTVTYPAEIVFGARSEPNIPSIMVYPSGPMLPQIDGGEGDTGGQIHWTMEVDVTAIYSEGSEEDLQRKQLRFQRAIKECLLKTRTGISGSFTISHIHDFYDPIVSYPPEDQAY